MRPAAPILLLALLASAAALPCGAAGIRIEAEALTNAYNYSGATIFKTNCIGSSGGLAVDGMDFPGEWIEIPFTLNETAVFVDSLRSAGYVSQYRQFSVHFLSQGGLEGAPGDTMTTGFGLGFS